METGLLHYATQVGESNHDGQARFTTMSLLTFGHLTPLTATHFIIIIIYGVQLCERSTKLLVTPKDDQKQELRQYSPT